MRLLEHLDVPLPMLGDASEDVGTSTPFNEYTSCVLYVPRPLILGAYSWISFELKIPFLPQKSVCYNCVQGTGCHFSF